MIDIDAAVAALTLDEKCRLLAGRTTWETHAFEHAGVPAIKMSDGPNGVRGQGHGGSGTPGVVVPSGITLGATWDPELVEEVGSLLGLEARRKSAHVLLAPTVNLHRTPVGGRTFECYSEDPELSGALAVGYVRGVQSHDVAVTVKHFVCNDTEIDRLTVNVDVDERPLRELYLRPFERAVVEGNAWGVMSAYNRLDGEHCAENRRLLTTILRDEWGFDGFVVSDWFGAHHTAPAANAGLNIEMPAPARVFGEHLTAAVERGDVSEDVVDGLVRDVLLLARRVRADERPADDPEESVDVPEERALTRRAAIAGTVLLRNEPGDGDRPVLPFDRASLRTIAVIGPNADIDRSIGGGSASLIPLRHRTLLAALRDRLPDATITDEPGVRIDRLTPVARRHQLRQPNGEPGMQVSYVNGRDWDGEVVVEQPNPTSMIRFFGSTPAGIDPTGFSARIEGTYIPDVDGVHTIGVVSTGPVVVTVTPPGSATTTVVDDPEMEIPRSEEFFGYGSVHVTEDVEFVAGEPVALSARWTTATGNGFAALRIGIRPPEPPDLMERAVAAAANADAAIVVVGTNDEWETEGFDRTSMDLPGRQDELVRRVVAANPNSAIVVNAGSPVTMDWADDAHPDSARAVVTSFFAGQEQAEAMVDVLFGDADPGGRLPLTIPVRLEDHPAAEYHRPIRTTESGPTQRYGEGLFVGYRSYDARDLAPRFPFGHGLSYGRSTWGEARFDIESAVADRSARVVVTVPVSADGDRPATVVVQGYVSPVDPPVVRPPKELRTWRKIVVDPGTTVDAELVFDAAAFQRWDPATNGWVVDTGAYDLVLATSATDERARHRIELRSPA